MSSCHRNQGTRLTRKAQKSITAVFFLGQSLSCLLSFFAIFFFFQEIRKFKKKTKTTKKTSPNSKTLNWIKIFKLSVIVNEILGCSITWKTSKKGISAKYLRESLHLKLEDILSSDLENDYAVLCIMEAICAYLGFFNHMLQSGQKNETIFFPLCFKKPNPNCIQIFIRYLMTHQKTTMFYKGMKRGGRKS